MEKGEKQRAHLIDVARDLFAQKGYEATTTRALNQAAGTSDGLLYYYFPHGKQQILDTIVREGVVQRVDDLQLNLSAVDTPEALERKLTDFIVAVWQLFVREDNYQSFMITIRERMLLSDEESAWLARYTENIRTKLTDAFGSVVSILSCSKAQVPVLVDIMIALVQGTLYEQLIIQNKRNVDDAQMQKLQREIHLVLNSNN